MLGAIAGDMIGAPYEFSQHMKSKEFPLFTKDSQFTDDTVLTVAVAESLLLWRESLPRDPSSNRKAATRKASLASFKAILTERLEHWALRYPNAGYGTLFMRQICTGGIRPYNSYGNGSAMRVSPVGWFFDDLKTTELLAKASAEVTHNHPEGIKGAQSVAAAIFLARTGSSKEAIKAYITKTYGYNLERTLDEIRPQYCHVESCQESVPEAIICFLESTGYEDAVRNAVSLGGDADTQAAIAGSIAEAYYGIPYAITVETLTRLFEDQRAVVAQSCKGLAVLRWFDDMDGMKVIAAGSGLS